MPDKKQNNAKPVGSESPAGQETVVKVGAYFREERLKKGITLEDVAEATSIRLGILQALEENDRGGLPAEVFVRGFIRIYAEYLGLDSEECLARYWQDEGAVRQGADEINVQNMLRLRPVDEIPSFSAGRVFGLVFLALFVGFLGYQVFTIFTESEQSLERAVINSAPVPLGGGQDASVAGPAQKEKDLVAVVADSGAESVAVEERGLPDGPAQGAVVAEQLPVEFKYVLEARFVEDTWLWIKIDSQDSQEFIFHDGERHIWKAQELIDIYFGNAGGAELHLNGRQLPKLGESGKTIKVSIPQDFSG